MQQPTKATTAAHGDGNNGNDGRDDVAGDCFDDGLDRNNSEGRQQSTKKEGDGNGDDGEGDSESKGDGCNNGKHGGAVRAGAAAGKSINNCTR
jgi:hypothetical protein